METRLNINDKFNAMDVYYSITPYNSKTKQVDWSHPYCEQVKGKVTLPDSSKESKVKSS
jgi:hypothetical protein